MQSSAVRSVAILVVLLHAGMVQAQKPDSQLPNLVIIFTDDQGWADVGVQGAQGFETPNLDRMAQEGVRFTSFYTAQPVCSASRAALLTGCYPNRIGISGALGPRATHGLHEREVTLAEICKSRGYATAMYGKWHLGHLPKFLPTRHGFDEYVGTPYSNDMWPLHPDLVRMPNSTAKRKRGYPNLPLIEGDQIIDSEITPKDQTRFTTLFTEKAVGFIERNRESPFFLYVAHPMPHVPLFVSKKHEGVSKQGMYGDVISEIDWSVGRILAALEKNGISDRTLVIFTSDNGPWLSYGNHGGSAGPLREGKGTTWEGGVRVPCIMRWPKKIPSGSVRDEPVMTIDVLPTFAKLIDAPLPAHRIDGKDIWPLMSGAPDAVSPHDVLYFYYHRNNLEALRAGRWKLMLPHRYRSLTGKPGMDGRPHGYSQVRCELELYDLETDLSERNDVSAANPKVVERLVRLAEEARKDLGDTLTKRPGANRRDPGKQEGPEVPKPIRIERKGGKPTIPDVSRDRVICFALYTVQDRVLKLSAQLYPLEKDEEHQVHLEVEVEGAWKRISTADVDPQGWLAVFRVEDWEHAKNHRYRVTHAGGASYAGVIRKDPRDKQEVVVAAFTGNSNSDRQPRPDIIKNIKAQNPDLLFFSGDQSYDHKAHTAAWLLFGRQFGEIIRDRPTITIPDDHDVGQGNLWGEGGKVSRLGGGADGGYRMPARYVNMVQRAQTSHLPDPFDPTPIKQGITVYYTSLNVGGVDFAIVEDRKWKTGPAGIVPQQGPRPDHINNPNYDRSAVDVPEARLLGRRQLAFLRAWGREWGGAEMKAVLSQTIFAGGAHIHGKHNARLLADLDSNGWPQSGRTRALAEIRRCFGFHIAGDQHLATVIHHGINAWEDSGWSFCVPSIVNYYGRWWWPLEKPLDHAVENPLPFTGRYFDGLGNRLTMQAYANPRKENHNAAGYGLVRFDKSSRKITIECWPRHVDVTRPDAAQHPGWPVTIDQVDNYGRDALAWLPTIQVTGATDPVVQVIDEFDGDVVYTLRIKGTSFRPKVFREGSYTIKVGEGESRQAFTGVKSLELGEKRTMHVEF